MTQRHSLLRTLPVLFSLLLLTSQTSLAEERPTLKVGAILPLTGPIAWLGEAFRQGMTLAAEDARYVRLDLHIEDDKTAKKEAVQAARKLVDVDDVDVVFSAYASTAPALTPILKPAEVPCIIIWDSNRTLPVQGPHVVGFGFSNEQAGEHMAEFAVKNRQRKTAAVISLNDEWSEVISNAFIARFEQRGGKVVLHERVNFETNDFKSLLTRIKAAGAEALYLPLVPPGLSTAIRQARDLNYEGDLLATDDIIDAEVSQLGAAAEGIYAAQISLKNEGFQKKVQARFGGTTSPINLGYIALAYDALTMVDELSGEIINSGNEASARTILAAIPGSTFAGLLGTTTFSGDRTVERREDIFQVIDGKITLVSKAEEQ